MPGEIIKEIFSYVVFTEKDLIREISKNIFNDFLKIKDFLWQKEFNHGNFFIILIYFK